MIVGGTFMSRLDPNRRVRSTLELLLGLLDELEAEPRRVAEDVLLPLRRELDRLAPEPDPRHSHAGPEQTDIADRLPTGGPR